MSTDVLKAKVNNLCKENFYEKKKFNVLIVFSISHKSGVKIFFKLIFSHCPKGTH